MKIPILAAFALLALVGANDIDADTDEEIVSMDDNGVRRLDDRGWYPDKDPNPKGCGWKVYDKNGYCYKEYYCKGDDGKYGKAIKGGKIDKDYCGISSSSTTTTTTTTTTSSSSDSSSSDCKKWKKKYKKCKKNNKTKKCKKKSYYKKYKKHC